MKISLKFQLISILAIGLTMAFAGPLLIRHSIEIPALIAQETVADAKDIERVRHALMQMQNTMVLSANDYAAWDDSYEFIVAEQTDSIYQNYLEANLEDQSLEILGVDGVLFVSASGPVKHSFLSPKTREKLGPGEQFSPPRIKVPLSFLEHGRVNDVFISAGVTAGKLGPMMYAASHIVTSDLPYPAPRGTLILFRLLDEEFFQKLGNDLQTRLQFIPISQAETESEYTHALGALKAQRSEQLPRDENGKLYWLLNDNEHQAMFLVEQDADLRGFSESILSSSVLVGFVSSAAILIILAAIFSRTVISRLVSAKKTMVSIVDTGDYSRRLSSGNRDELDTVFDQFNLLLEHIQEQNQDLIQKNQELSELSEKDALTGIPNRRFLDIKLLDGWRQCQRSKSQLSVLMIDVDYFKPFNDNYGHPAGDEVLKKIAQAMQQGLYRPTDFLARYGGEEFCVVLVDTDADAALEVAERLRRTIENLTIRSDVSKCANVVTASIGVSTCSPSSTVVDTDLVKIADEALYQAKSRGRNRVYMKRGAAKVTALFGQSS